VGFDFSQLPGGGGETGEVVTSLELAINVTACIGLLDIFACFNAVIELFSLLYDLFFQDLFGGRAKVGKDSASDDTALFFIASTNPVIKHWGIGIRAMEAQGIPTSVSGGVGLTKTIQLADAVLADLRRQFDGPTAPKQVLHNQFGTAPVTGLNMFTWYRQLGFNNHNPDSNPGALQERQIIDNFYNTLVRDNYIDPKTGFPHQPGTPPPKKQPPPPPPPGLPHPPSSPPPGYDNQELCCWYEEQYAYHQAASIDHIAQLLAAKGQDEACCNKVVASLTSIHSGIAAITTAIAAGARELAHPIDLTPIERGLGSLITELHADNALAHTAAEGMAKALERIAAAEEKERPIDLKPVVDQLAKIVDEGDVKQHVLDYLTKQGFMSGADAQVIVGAHWADALIGIFRTWGWNAVLWVAGWAGLTYDGHKWHIKTLSTTIAEDIARAIDDALNYGSDPIYPIVKGLVEGVVKQLEPAHAVHIGDAGVNPELLLTKTLAPVFILNGVALVAGYLGWEMSEQLKSYVEWAAALTGLEEIRELEVGARMRFGPVRVAEMNAKRMYRQEIPGSSVLYGLASRALVTEARAAAINGYNGVPDELHGPLQTAAYGGLNPRQLLRLSATGLFDEHDLADEMTFAGLRAVSQHRMLLAAPYLASEPQRAQLRSALEKGYVEGFVAENDLVQQLDDAEHNTSRTFLVLDRVRLEKRMSIAKLLEEEYTALYLGNLSNLETYHAHLAGLGLQPDRVNALLARNEARAAVTLARQEAAAARALARATAAEERKAAIRNYLEGHINAAALAAALVLTGLTTTQTAAWVDMAALQKEGLPRYAFGLRLGAPEASLLTARVHALTDQRKRQLLKDVEYANALKALKIPPRYINALRATADAMLTPAKAALVLPVETGG
jgi:hypothetical protein